MTAIPMQPCTLAPDEIFAAYLAHEPHVMAMLRLVMEMSDEQRRMALTMMQCMALGHGGTQPRRD